MPVLFFDAIKSGNPEAVAGYLKAGISAQVECESKTALRASIGKPEIMRLLIDAKAEVAPAYRRGRINPLHWATMYGDIASMKVLIEHGAPVDQVSTDKLIPLQIAHQSDNAEAVALLLKSNARRGLNLQSAYDQAQAENNPKMAETIKPYLG